MKSKTLATSAAGNNGIPTTVQPLEKRFPVRSDDRRDTNAKQNLLVIPRPCD